MNNKLNPTLLDTILSLNFIENLFTDKIKEEIIDNSITLSIQDHIFKTISFIRDGFYNMIFIRTIKASFEVSSTMIFSKPLKGFSSKYKGTYKKEHNFIGTSIVNLLNNFPLIISYINVAKEMIAKETKVATVNTYINYLYLQLYLISKTSIFVIYDIFNKISLYEESQKLNLELSKHNKKDIECSIPSEKSYNLIILDILDREILNLQKLANKVKIIFSISSSRGYKQLSTTDVNIKVPYNIIKYYTITGSKKAKPYYYKYSVSSLINMFDVSIYQIYLNNRVVSNCSLKSCNHFFVSKKRNDEHFCSSTCKDKFDSQKNVNRDDISYNNSIIIKQIKDFLSRPAITNGIKIKQEDRLKELCKFENTLFSKKQQLSDKSLNSWLVSKKEKYLDNFSKKKKI